MEISKANYYPDFTGIKSGDGLPASVCLSVSKGEFVAIVGPPGCGKSNLIDFGLGLRTDFRGSIAIDDIEVVAMRANIALVPPHPTLLPWRTIIENVMPQKLIGAKLQKADGVARGLLRKIGMHGLEEKLPYEVSELMQRRTAVARAFAQDPKVILMDEPFAGLDLLSRESVCLDLQNIWLEDKKTVIYTTRRVPEALLLADRVILMSAQPGLMTRELKILGQRPRDIGWLSSPEAIELTCDILGRLDNNAPRSEFI